MKIAIRFGHTILKNGTITSAKGIKSEFTMIREYGPYVIQSLIKAGHKVINVTPPNKSFNTEIEDINAGIKKANDADVDLFISLHVNASNGEGNGCEVLYSNGNEKAKAIAASICVEISKLGFRNRGAKFDVRGLNEIRKTSMTALIIEPYFCDNANDIKLYNPKKLGEAVAAGILKAIK